MTPHGPPDWPQPWSYYLLENPWPVASCLLAVVAAMMLVGYRSGRRGPRIVAVVAACITSLMVVVASAVTTDREKMVRGTDALVRAAIVPPHIDVFRRMLSKDVALFGRDYDSVLSGIERGLDRWHVQQAFTTNLMVDQADATHGQTYLAVITRLDTNIGGGSTLTRWLLHWRKESDGVWRVVKIEWLTLNDSPAQAGDLP